MTDLDVIANKLMRGDLTALSTAELQFVLDADQDTMNALLDNVGAKIAVAEIARLRRPAQRTGVRRVARGFRRLS